MWYTFILMFMAGGNRSFIRKPSLRTAGVALLATVFLACTGCQSTRGIDVTTLVFNEDGSVTSVVVEDFEADYYDVEELKAQVEEEAGAYNLRQGEDRVKISECKANKGTVRLVMEYMAPEDYAAFNRVVLQVAGNTVTVSEPVHVRTVKKIASVSDGVEILSDREAGVGEDAALPAMITTED